MINNCNLWRLYCCLCIVVCVLFASHSHASQIPRPEHPRPDLLREQWLNLNGEWEFAETDDDSDETFLGAAPYPDRIIVPFCRESSLSGLGRRGFVRNVWYRRSFTVPDDWSRKRVLVHVGACDWRTRVWVNGVLLGEHKGGSVPFSFEATRHLSAAENTIVIHAFDDLRSGFQAGGKQSSREESHGCFYTRTTGIWQTVWLEAVGSSFIRQYNVTPDVANSRVVIQVEMDGSTQGLTLHAEALANGKAVAKAETSADWRNNVLTLNLGSKRRLWSPDDPFLYDLELRLVQGKNLVDSLKGYFGLRAVSIEGAAILINGRPVFQRLILDQGFYPDGVWTAPSDEALKGDILLSQAMGYNGARLHQKVFEPRFLYWADRLGYMVWGEYPNWGMDYGKREACLTLLDEWTAIVNRDRNHPSIIGWCPFNETPHSACPLQKTVVHVTRTMDLTRPVLETSGWVHSLPDPELLDAHDYNQNPVSFRAVYAGGFDLQIPAQYGFAPSHRDKPFFISEFGGIGWNLEDGWGYGSSPKSEEEFYERYEGLVNVLLDNRWMFGFCYTQLTDVEQEQNGLYRYDRTPKFDTERIWKITSRRARYEDEPPLNGSHSDIAWRVLVGAAVDGDHAQTWRYQMETEPGEGWKTFDFDDNSWHMSTGGFGNKGGWESRTGTTWTGKDIWLRGRFEYDGSAFDKAVLVTHYDNATEIYINGQVVWKGEGWNDAYAPFEITDTLKRALKRGTNTITVHCHQDEGGQFIDLAVLVSQ